MWIFVSLIAQFILGTSAVFDKVLLKRSFFDPWSYTFWAALLGVFALVLLPFGSLQTPAPLVALALSGGAVFISAVYFFFLALNKGEASVTLPVIGGLAPVFTLLISTFFLSGSLSWGEIIGFLFLVSGGILFLGAEKKEIRLVIFLIALLSAFLFGVANVITKLVFEKSSFVAGVIWMRLGGVFAAVFLLIFPSLRRKISESIRASEVTNRFLYLFNRGYAALGNLMVAGAIFLAHPALVDASSSLKYVVIFFAAWILLKERFYGRVLWLKAAAVILIILGLTGLGLVEYSRSISVDEGREILWGVTFSAKFSRGFGLLWKENFKAILDELGPKRVRLPVYWDETEPWDDRYDFSEIDWQFKEAEARGVKVFLAIGRKLPRWPECHEPQWARNQKSKIKNQKLLEHLEIVVKRYRDHPALWAWQVENEPFLPFGKDCPLLGGKFLDEEIALVRRLDPGRPIIVTDSGELSFWVRAAKRADIFGTTMYRQVWNENIGFFTYPLPPEFFRVKRALTEFFVGEKPMLVSELQLEPWGPKLLYDLPLEEGLQFFDIENFRENIRYAKNSGFDEFYLWGVEWWWWLKINGHPEIWDEAKKLF